MDPINAITGFGTLIAIAIGVTIPLLQLNASRRDAHASRVAELSWQIYQTYESAEMRSARMIIEHISHTLPIPQSGEEYDQMYVLKSSSDG